MSNEKQAKQYPVDILRKLYITSDETLEQIAAEFGMPIVQLERLARTEEKSWHQLKAEYKKERLDYFREMSEDNGIELMSVLEELHLITIVDIRSKINFLKKYYKEHGDLYTRNKEGEVLLDGRGQPISLTIPNSPKELLSLQGLLKLKTEAKENVRKSISEAPESPKAIEESIIDISDYGIFKE
jgi:hypothetical protein